MNRIKDYRTAARLVLAAAMAVTLLALPLVSQAATYSYTDLTPTGFTRSSGFGISGSKQIGAGSGPATGSALHALLWSGTASSVVDLNPSGFTESRGYGISGSQQVGWASGPTTGSNQHAFLWSGTASSAVDLNPSGFTWSLGRANSGSQQIGYGYGPATGSNQHALLWSGTASSVVDLNPSGFTQSSGEGIYGTHQVGRGSGPATGNIDHALLWSGTASSVVDLNPSGFTGSGALGIYGSQQVGLGYGSGTGNNNHALLWSGSASSVVDLNPSGFTMSVASGISGSQQVGYGASGNNTRALLWSGTASSAVDLGSFLSSDYSNWSVAEGIDANGNIFGYAVYIPTGETHAILWTAVPGPHAIYRFAQNETVLGNGQLIHATSRGYAVFEPDTQRGTLVGGFTLNNAGYFVIKPLQNYRLDHVSGPNGASYTVLAKAESPGTQFAGTLLEAVYSRGRDSSVMLRAGDAAGVRQLPTTLSFLGRGILQGPQNGAKFASEARGTYVLDIKATQISNLANESLEATVTRFSNSFIARGFSDVTPPPAQ